jgi:hypothetical protein
MRCPPKTSILRTRSRNPCTECKFKDAHTNTWKLEFVAQRKKQEQVGLGNLYTTTLKCLM